MKQTILFILVCCFAFASCKKNSSDTPVQPSQAYNDADVFVNLIPYPCASWGGNEAEIESWELVHAGTLDKKKSEELSKKEYRILWFNVKSKTNPVRIYFLSGDRNDQLVEAVGYYSPCELVLNPDGTALSPHVDKLLMDNTYEYTGLNGGYHQYTSRKVGRIIRITRVKYEGQILASVNYLKKPE